MSRIIELRAENIKRLSAVHITPKGNLVIIGGKNGQGKTSVLDAITMALGGANEIPAQPIRTGQESAKIMLETDDLIITRRFTASGSTVVVENRDKMRASAPQAILDKLTGKLTFDPVAFMRIEPAKQRAALMNLVALDFKEEDAERKRLFDERTVAGRKLDDAVAVLHSLPAYPDTPDSEISVADTIVELETAQATNQRAKELADEAQRAHEDAMEGAQSADVIAQGIAETEQQIASLQKKLSTLKTEHADQLRLVAKLIAEAEARAKTASGAPTVDVAPIREKLSTAEVTNRNVRANAKKKEQQKLVQDLSAQANGLTEAIQHIDAAKKKKLAEAKFPVSGLSFDDRGVTFNGVPLAQASAAEQLRVSVAMAVALNPKLRVMIVRDASLLDEESLAHLEQLANEHDCQIWAERVGKGDRTAVIIEDGAVLAQNGSDAA